MDHRIAGLGFGVGLAHDQVPEAIVEEAERHGFPLFEVPYEMPFIAITEKAFARLVNEQYEVLQRGIAVQRRLEQLVLEQRGLDEVARALSAAIGGSVVMLDGRGEVAASANFRRPRAGARAGGDPRGGRAPQRVGSRRGLRAHRRAVGGRALALPVAPDAAAGPRAWIVRCATAARWASSSD